MNRPDLTKRGRVTNNVTAMAAAYLPSILVPLVGLVFPAVAMTSIFLYVEKQTVN
jgi:photosystem I subunit 8